MGDAPARRSGSRPARRGTEVIAHGRAHEAHRLRLAGLGWHEVAERVGYLDDKVAATAVNAYLQKVALEQAPDQRRVALELELARLDQIQAAYYPTAIAGDIAAANFVLKVIARRCAILGFDKPDGDIANPPRTIVIAGTPEAYVAKLQALVEGGDPDAIPEDLC